MGDTMLQGTKDWFEATVKVAVGEATAKLRSQLGFAVGAAADRVVHTVVASSAGVKEAVAARCGELLVGQHEAQDAANERHHALVELLDRASTERAALLEKLQSVDTQIELGLGKVIERQTRSTAIAKHDRKELVKQQVAGPVTGLAGPARKGGDAPEQLLGANGSAPMPKPATPAEPLVSVSTYPPRVQERLVAAMRNGEIPGGVKRPGRSKPGGWCAPASSIGEWLHKHPTADPVDA